MRKVISKKTRFEIFKRDSFKCQYCGSIPPHVVLEVDHIIPVKQGGKNELENLITACFECNRGKGARELSAIPNSLEDKIKLIKAKEKQYKEFKKLQDKIILRLENEIDEVQKVYKESHSNYYFKPKFRSSVKMFIEKLGAEKVIQCMEFACRKVNDNNECLTYFCGVCWKTIKGDTYER